MSRFLRGNKVRTFKLIESKNGPTTFLPINANISGQIKHTIDRETRYLTEDRLDETSRDINPYHEILVNNTEKHDIILS